MSNNATPTNPNQGADASTPTTSAETSCPAECPRCRAPLTEAQVQEMFPQAPADKRSELLAAFNEAYMKFDINKCLRKAHFFAQVMEEVPTLKAKEENMKYSAPRAKKVFKYFRDHPQEAKLYEFQEQEIANRAYAGRNGNGDIASGDGWRFRGKGYLQLTGRSNYQAVQSEIDKRFPGSGINIMANDTDILTPRGAMLSAMGFWTVNGLNAKADRGSTGGHVDEITKIVNKHTDTYGKRRENFEKTKKVFKVPECVEKLKFEVPVGGGRRRRRRR